MAHWAQAPLNRQQILLFSPTLDQTLIQDHPVRFFAEVLDQMDFSSWESMYVRVLGQPPIHPRVLAGCIIYGLSLGIRSSRKLELASINSLDFIWLMEGRTPDHATIAKFRTQFAPQIKALFKQTGRVAMEMGLLALNAVMLDGTDTRANNSRYATNRKATLQQKIAALDQQVERAMQEAQEQDARDDALFGPDASATKLPRHLRDLKERQERLGKALKNLEQIEQTRQGRKDLSPKGPAIATTDPEARVLPAKGGGHAPAYTTVLASDSRHGIILDVQVLAGNDEGATVLPAVTNIEQNLGKKPQQLVADSNFNNGPNLHGLQQQGVEALMPPRQQAKGSNPAVRCDPSVALAAEQWAQLPVNPQNKVLDRSAFVYDPQQDRYFCPMGRVLERVADERYRHHGNKGIYRMYQCGSCRACALASKCLIRNAASRRLCRDEHEELREAMARRMQSPEGKACYRQRGPVAETPFANLKSKMNFRQFLLRGLAKVSTEAYWVSCAYNLWKLVRLRLAGHPAPARA